MLPRLPRQALSQSFFKNPRRPFFQPSGPFPCGEVSFYVNARRRSSALPDFFHFSPHHPWKPAPAGHHRDFRQSDFLMTGGTEEAGGAAGTAPRWRWARDEHRQPTPKAAPCPQYDEARGGTAATGAGQPSLLAGYWPAQRPGTGRPGQPKPGKCATRGTHCKEAWNMGGPIRRLSLWALPTGGLADEGNLIYICIGPAGPQSGSLSGCLHGAVSCHVPVMCTVLPRARARTRPRTRPCIRPPYPYGPQPRRVVARSVRFNQIRPPCGIPLAMGGECAYERTMNRQQNILVLLCGVVVRPES